MANYFNVDANLTIIDLDQKPEGFRRFISSWLYRSKELTFLVDPGPLYSIGSLTNALGEIGVRKLDYILLTHIHIDHAGGTGKLLQVFPETRVLCHPMGIDHMVTPAKLWEGSVKILGELALAYGEIVPIPRGNIFYEEKISLGENDIHVVETPGHAPHHLSYLFKHYLFAGEVAGVHQPLADGIYLRPATPPKFKLETSLSSLEKVIEMAPQTICFGHYGHHHDALSMLRLGREQLRLWTEVLKEHHGHGAADSPERLMEDLLKRDTYFANYLCLERDIRKREEYFVMNSIRGIMDYLNNPVAKG
jgi:glyoxylase-like metal-dependent hydrolase (beta-lactamase superfamily II)